MHHAQFSGARRLGHVRRQRGMPNLPDLAANTSALPPRYVFSDSVLTQVLPNVHGDSSGVRGAAWLWPRG